MKFKDLKVGDILRNKKTLELWLIIDFSEGGIYITNLFLNFDPMPVLFLFPRDSNNWEIEPEDNKLSEVDKRILETKADIIELYRK